MNVADSEVVASVMQMADYEVTTDIQDADAVFLNTCSVRDNAEQKIYHRLEELNAMRNKRTSDSNGAPHSSVNHRCSWLYGRAGKG